MKRSSAVIRPSLRKPILDEYQRLHEAFRQALFHPRFVESLARYDQEVAYLGPEAYARACREEYAREREASSRPGWARDAGAAR